MFGGESTINHHQNAMANCEQLGHVVRNDDNGCTILSQIGYQLMDFVLGADVDANSWSVENQDLWF